MKYTYNAYIEDDAEPIQRAQINDNRKIKETVTINICIEMEKSRYDAKREKYKEPIPEKVLKIFK